MVSWPSCTEKLHGVKANEVKIMLTEHTVRRTSNQGAPDDAPEFALASTTYNRKRNLIISITQIIFRRTFRKEEDILDKNVQNNNNTQVEVDMHHDSVPFELSS